MTDINISATDTPGVRGHTRSTWRDETHLRGMLLRLMTLHPDISREELEEMYLARTRLVPALVDEALRRAFDNDIQNIQKPPRVKPPRAEAEVKAEQGRVVAAVEHIKQTVLLDLVLPNGKKLRDCTGRECREAGGWLVKVGKQVGERGIVGEKLSEADVANILKTQPSKESK